MTNRTQFHNSMMNRNMPSNSRPQNGESVLGGVTTQLPNPNRLGKQTASGDTGDNSACEHAKRSLAGDCNSNTQYNKPIHIQSGNSSVTPANGPSTQAICGQSSATLRYNATQTTAPSNSTENKTNLIINYLPPNMSQEEVRALFSSVGEVESCKLVREKTSGESLGYAFVKFYDPADAGKAIKTLNGLRLQNKTVKVSLARPSSEAIKGANLYICGLPRKMTQAELEKLFGSCGHIITARILYDTKTGLSRGVAFIRYDQRTEAEFAIRKLNGYLPPGATEQITVKFANSPSSNRTENSNSCYTRAAEGDNVSRYVVSSTGNSANVIGLHAERTGSSRSTNAGNGRQTSQSPSQNRTVGNTGFTEHSTNIGYVYPASNNPGCGANCNPVCPYANGVDVCQNPGCSVQPQPNCFQPHLLSNGFPLTLSNTGSCVNGANGRPDTSVASPLHRVHSSARLKLQAAGAAISNGGSPGLRSSNGILNGGFIPPSFPTGLPAFGVDIVRNLGPSAQALLAPAFAASSGALTSTGWCIFVYNLAPDTEESVLWQLFGPFGAVQTVKVIRDPVAGKCRGFGFVTMSNYEEALLAIHSLNGFNLGNRVLQVSFKTTPNSRQMKYVATTAPDVALMTGFTGSLTPVPGTFAKNS